MATYIIEPNEEKCRKLLPDLPVRIVRVVVDEERGAWRSTLITELERPSKRSRPPQSSPTFLKQEPLTSAGELRPRTIREISQARKPKVMPEIPDQNSGSTEPALQKAVSPQSAEERL